MKLNKFIKQYRLSKNLNQKQFAELCGLDQSRISLIESGNLDVGYLVINKLSKVTGKTPEELRKML